MALDLLIVTPLGEAWRGEVDSVVLPGSEGDFGVLEGHERFLAPLRTGEAEIRAAGRRTWAAIASGFADVSSRDVTVLVESCEVADEIDAARAEIERDRAREGLARLGADASRERYEQFENALRLAEARLAVSRRPKD
jgi:F-type H+-transporting ATPase subunit epsilon